MKYLISEDYVKWLSGYHVPKGVETPSLSNLPNFKDEDIIFDSTKISDLNNTIQLDTEKLWSEQEFVTSLLHNAKPLDKDNRISIIITTYTRPELLKRAVASVLNQSYQNFKLIIVGDCCPVLSNLDLTCAPSDKIVIHNMEKNSKDGGTTPKNYALQNLVDTKWVTYLDDDNYYYRDHLLYFYPFICSDKYSFGLSSMIM